MRRLDRLRSVKNRMVRLNTRVETVRRSWCRPCVHAGVSSALHAPGGACGGALIMMAANM